ncbi:MAG: phospho-N-acetylmuramoyl-pentapeptide-transferase [Chthonomonadales bacterium]|nr:phospho-N-acetylmuramoyl-pentapeptide-transferase [Chthonomonadales bacterium]
MGLSAPAAVFAAAFAVSVLVGGPCIRALRRVGARQTVSANAPAAHAGKQGTPTMGGLILLAGLVAAAALSAQATGDAGAVAGLLGVTLAFGAIGFLDDYLKAARGKNLGLIARQKLALQFAAATAFALWLAAQHRPGQSVLLGADLGVWYYALAALLLVAVSNAVNLADGLDGLAAGICGLVGVGVVLVAAGRVGAMTGAATAGACAGFLWHNAHPAAVFMGDTGSLPLGAALAAAAVLAKGEVAFLGLAAVLWLEMASVIVQVSVFKLRRRRGGLEYARAHRVFRRTPLHHHFEELGWPETRVVQRFWLATAVAVAITLSLCG